MSHSKGAQEAPFSQHITSIELTGVFMAAITATMVAELRAKTDAPMMECKKALTEADGDMVKADELLRV